MYTPVITNPLFECLQFYMLFYQNSSMIQSHLGKWENEGVCLLII